MRRPSIWSWPCRPSGGIGARPSDQHFVVAFVGEDRLAGRARCRPVSLLLGAVQDRAGGVERVGRAVNAGSSAEKVVETLRLSVYEDGTER